jgi:anti-sigma factor RsiW
MLSCQDCEHYLTAFLDHELEVKVSLDIQAHLHACMPCTQRLEVERTLRQFIRQHGRVAPLAEDIKRRLIQRAMQPLPVLPWWRRLGASQPVQDFVKGVAAAAVILLVLSYFLANSPGDKIVQKFLQETSMAYWTYTTQHMPPEVESTDDAVVTQWITSRMGYPFKVPCITDGATQLLGGRLCRIADRKSATLIYKRNGVDVLLFAFKGEPLSLPATPTRHLKDQGFYIQSVGGRPVAMWQRGGITYSLVGDLPSDELLRLATTVNYR